MTESTNNPNRRRIFSLRKREEKVEALQIRGQQTGNIRVDEPVVIEVDAVVSGDVTAPEIRVDGLLRGTAVTYNLIITSTGQIWGDVMTNQIQLDPGGRIQGWIGTLSTDEPLPTEEETNITTALLPELPAGLDTPPTRTKSQHNLMRHLQNMAGQAQADYTALKKEFDERLEKRAGTALNKVDALTEKLDETKLQLKQTQKELGKTKTTLANRDATIQEQNEDLAEAAAAANQRQQELADLSLSYQQLAEEQEALQEAKNVVDMSLLEALKDGDTLKEQIRTLEETLQSSIQRTTEQEDALLHWQELAGTNQKSIVKLEGERDKLNQELDESAQITGKLREKNSQLEFELQQLLNDMDELRNRLPDATMEEMQFSLADAHQQIATLNGLIEEAEAATAEKEEQNMWLSANLKTAQRALEESRQVIARQAVLLEEIQSEKSSEEQLTGKWRTAVEEMAARLQEKEKEFKRAKDQHSEQIGRMEAALSEQQEAIRHKVLQIEALEAEIENNLEQADEQGQRLADVQARLIEQEIAANQMNKLLKQAKNKIAWQANFINKMKRVTSETIANLEAQLEQARKQNNI